MEKAVLINSENVVVNLIVWDETCVAPEGTTAIVLDPDVSGLTAGWIWDGTNFINPNPPPEPEPIPEPEPLTPQEKLETAGLTVEELKALLGL